MKKEPKKIKQEKLNKIINRTIKKNNVKEALKKLS